MWKEDSLIAFDQCPNWVSNEFMSPRWMGEEIAKLLEQNQIFDYKIIVTEFAKLNCSTYIDNLKEKNIIIVHTDHLYHDNLLRYANFTSSEEYTLPFLISDTMTIIVDTANKNPDKNIIFYSLVANLIREIEQLAIPDNLIIEYTETGNLCHKIAEYKNAPLVTSKSSEARTFVCLNNNNRPHRMAAIAYLLASDIDQYGYISCINWEMDSTASCFLDWCFDNNLHSSIRDNIKQGTAKFDANKLIQLPYTGYYLTNYNQILFPLYHTTLIDIITDTTFFEPSELLNDKYVNTIVGANFPIFISSCGTVELLRQLGFDVFDDVIDHSYDDISDPAVRLSQAIDLNKHLLMNAELTRQLWHTHIDRFKQNQHYFFNGFKPVGENILRLKIKSGITKLIKQS